MSLPKFAKPITEYLQVKREFRHGKTHVIVKRRRIIIHNECGSFHIYPDELEGIQEMLEQAREFLFGPLEDE